MILKSEQRIERQAVESDSFSSWKIVVRTWINADDNNSSSQI